MQYIHIVTSRECIFQEGNIYSMRSKAVDLFTLFFILSTFLFVRYFQSCAVGIIVCFFFFLTHKFVTNGGQSWVGINIVIQYFPAPLKLGGFLFLKFGQRGGHEKILQKQGGFQIVLSVILHKSMFSLLLEYFFFFFCLVKIHICCNQQIYSFTWFTFYQKMIYYEISFPLTLIFKFCEIFIINGIYFHSHFIKNFNYS